MQIAFLAHLLSRATELPRMLRAGRQKMVPKYGALSDKKSIDFYSTMKRRN
jgi:hypothetical protein